MISVFLTNMQYFIFPHADAVKELSVAKPNRYDMPQRLQRLIYRYYVGFGSRLLNPQYILLHTGRKTVRGSQMNSRSEFVRMIVDS